ncbi:MAG: FHA domain-containing protein, partial [Gemmataceae bacterium]|nr:FHA domain-containing protein [Gemmataceae bacterium]
MRKTTPGSDAGPALIVTHGSTKTKRRPLAKDLVVIGRGPACDIGLVSPEVAHVHCVVFRQGAGWAIRDCSGRATRVNGETISEHVLRDGDSIQVGTFSFEASLPGSGGAPVVAVQSAASAKQARLERSRKRLGELALRLRARVRD